MVRYVCVFWASQVALVVKNQSANAGDVRDMDLLPGSRRIHSRRKAWSPLQYSCLENPMVKEAWWAIVRSVAKSWTQLKWLSMCARACVYLLPLLNIYVYMWKSLSRVWLFITLWTIQVHGILQDSGVGSLSLLQGIFPTQRSNPGLLYCRQLFYQLNHKGGPSFEYGTYNKPVPQVRVGCCIFFLSSQLVVLVAWPGPLPHTGLTLSSGGPSGAGLQVASACFEELHSTHSPGPITTLYLSLPPVLEDDCKYVSTLFMPISFHREELSVRYVWTEGICFDICFSMCRPSQRFISGRI